MAKQAKDDEAEDSLRPEKAGIRKGVLGGVIMIVIAVAWFLLGYKAGRIFFYPPILFLIGVYAVIKGLVTGNLAGKKVPPRIRRP
jgi:4-hydroxybenzoate polyprenyltransferase